MASSAELRPLESRIKMLLNAKLKVILREQNLPVSGIKSELQIRLLTRKAARFACLFLSLISYKLLSYSMCSGADADTLDLNKLAAAGDVARIERIRTQVNGSSDAPSSPSSPVYSNSPPPTSSPHRSSLSQASAQLQAPPLYGMAPNPSAPTGNSLTVHASSVQFPDQLVGRLLFKASPFFTIIRPLTGVVECKGLFRCLSEGGPG